MVKKLISTAFPPDYAGEDPVRNELRYRAAVDSAFGTLVNNDQELSQRIDALGGGGGGATTFLQLTDTPTSYEGQDNKLVKVNPAGNGLIFVTQPPAGATTYLQLTDTPSSFSGQAAKIPVVNNSATALEFRTQGVRQFSDQDSYLFDDLVGFEGTVYHCINPVSGQPFSLTNFAPIVSATASGISFQYKWTTVTAGAPPNGRFGITLAMASVTNTIRVSKLTDRSIDVGGFWAQVDNGEAIMFVENTGGAESGIWVATGPSVDQGTYFTIPVNWVANTGEPENGRDGTVNLIANPQRLMPAGGTTGQALTKKTSNNYDTEWVTISGGGPYLPLTAASNYPVTGNLYIEVGGKASTNLSMILLGGYKDVDASSILRLMSEGGTTNPSAYIQRNAGKDGTLQYVQNGSGTSNFYANGGGTTQWWSSGSRIMSLASGGTLSVNENGNADGAIVFGAAAGGVALTVNDTQGNANVTFNHRDGIPDKTGSSARIAAGVDGTSASLSFELASSVTGGVEIDTLPIIYLNSDRVDVKQQINTQVTTDEQIRVAYNTTGADNPYISFYQGGTVRKGYIQSNSAGRFVINNDDGNAISLFPTYTHFSTSIQVTGAIDATGLLTLKSNSPSVRFDESDAPVGSKVFGITMITGALRVAAYADNGTYEGIRYTFEKDNSALSATTSVITRSAGDARYLQISNTTTLGAVGSSATMMQRTATTTDLIQGSTYAASTLWYGGTYTQAVDSGSQTQQTLSGGTNPAGTWRAMGRGYHPSVNHSGMATMVRTV